MPRTHKISGLGARARGNCDRRERTRPRRRRTSPPRSGSSHTRRGRGSRARRGARGSAWASARAPAEGVGGAAQEPRERGRPPAQGVDPEPRHILHHPLPWVVRTLREHPSSLEEKAGRAFGARCDAGQSFGRTAVDAGQPQPVQALAPEVVRCGSPGPLVRRRRRRPGRGPWSGPATWARGPRRVSRSSGGGRRRRSFPVRSGRRAPRAARSRAPWRWGSTRWSIGASCFYNDEALGWIEAKVEKVGGVGRSATLTLTTPDGKVRAEREASRSRRHRRGPRRRRRHGPARRPHGGDGAVDAPRPPRERTSTRTSEASSSRSTLTRRSRTGSTGTSRCTPTGRRTRPSRG